MQASDVPLRLLIPAVETARRTLRDLDSEEVPASIKKVAGKSGGRLAPPLARSLIREIDQNEWLRGKVVELWSIPEASAEDAAVRASGLFLERPNGWKEELAALAGRASEDDAAGEVERLQARLATLERELEVARSKARSADQRAREAERSARRKIKASKKVGKGRSDLTAETAELRRDRDELARDRHRLAVTLEETDARLKRIRAELLKERRAEAAVDPATPSAWSLRDPVALARHLDEISTAARAVDSQAAVGEATKPTTLILPSGVAPDQGKAVDWVVSQKLRLTLVVDGYNVTYHLDPTRFHTPVLRGRLNEELTSLRRRAAAAMRVIVVYDSDRGGIDEVSNTRGFEVRFTAPQMLADEEILELVPQISGHVVVVSSDRAVREGAEQAGALGLWSEALTAWIKSR